MLTCVSCAAYYGWERIGDIIPPPEADDNAVVVADTTTTCSAELKGEGAENCRVESSTPTKWVLLGHSMGTMATEAVCLVFFLWPAAVLFILRFLFSSKASICHHYSPSVSTLLDGWSKLRFFRS